MKLKNQRLNISKHCFLIHSSPTYSKMPSIAAAQLCLNCVLLTNNNIFIMPKEIMYVDMSNQYPFAQNGQKNQASNTIQVRKTIQYDHEPRFICKEKIRMLKSLGFQNLIGLESTKSEENSMILTFEYVPLQYLAEADALTEEKLAKIKDGMQQLTSSLASKGIVHDLEAKRVGLDKRHNLKYFLGMDFKIDKTADKQKLLEKYNNLVNNLLQKTTTTTPKIQKLNIPQNSDSNKAMNSNQFEINVMNLLGLEVPTERKILKKSSILDSEYLNDEIKERKASSRFTFNYDNHIKLPINEKDDQFEESKSGGKTVKNQDLSARINVLKGYMQEISVKVGSKKTLNINTAKTDQNDDCNSNRTKKIPPTPNFSKFEKKVNEFRESRLRKTSRDQEALCQKVSECIEMSHKAQPCKSLQSPEHYKSQKPPKHSEPLLNTVTIEPITPPASSFIKKNSLNIYEDDRQHQQYVMLANKDQYCAQFMQFLDNDEASDERSQRTVKKTGQNERPSITLQPAEPECKASRQRENLKTQSSENTLEIQSRVQKVIRSSLKLISGLRSRQSIRCE